MNVLIVEDDTLLKELLKKQLEMHGHDVMAYEMGANAIEAYKQVYYPLVIVDLGLPDMDGLDVCRQIRKTPWGKQSMILVITGRDTLEDVKDALEAGADDYLMKPITRTALEVRFAVIEQQLPIFTGYHQEIPYLKVFRNLIECANDMIVIVDLHTGRVIEVNHTVCERLGYVRPDLLNLSLAELVEEVASLPSWEQYVSALRQARSMIVDEHYRCKDGTLLPVESSLSFATQTEREYLVAIVRDRTDRSNS